MAGNKFQSEDMMARCVPMASVQAVLGGKWKILILWYVAFYKVQRFGQLMRRLDGITQSSLTKQLLPGDPAPGGVLPDRAGPELHPGPAADAAVERGPPLSARLCQPLRRGGARRGMTRGNPFLQRQMDPCRRLRLWRMDFHGNDPAGVEFSKK